MQVPKWHVMEPKWHGMLSSYQSHVGTNVRMDYYIAQQYGHSYDVGCTRYFQIASKNRDYDTMQQITVQKLNHIQCSEIIDYQSF